jgi:hypothetical protein
MIPKYYFTIAVVLYTVILHSLFSFFEILFSVIVESILDLEPEALQAALNTTVVGGLVASQQVSKNKKQLHIILFYFS